ncbi:hypothetical protein PFISCL1PPCAC_9166, partial [Pristionchus fissidentatus]
CERWKALKERQRTNWDCNWMCGRSPNFWDSEPVKVEKRNAQHMTEYKRKFESCVNECESRNTFEYADCHRACGTYPIRWDSELASKVAKRNADNDEERDAYFDQCVANKAARS